MHARQSSGVGSHEFGAQTKPLVQPLCRNHGAFVIAFLIVVVWAASGPLFHYSDTWQLVINTGTTIVTFLMVFLIQNTQNRDTRALQVKLSEVILALETANNRIAAIENASPEELDAAQEEIQQRAQEPQV
jgi:low affinity Fe/Cu permease